MKFERGVVVLGQRRSLSLLRQVDMVQSLGLWVPLIPALLLIGSGELDFHNPVATLGSANRLLAVFGTALLMVHLALVARVPWIEKVLGLDKMTSAHKRLGKPLVAVLTAHMLLSIVAFAEVGNLPIWQTIADLNLHYWSIALASAGLGLMLIVTFSSIKAARKSLSYEAWFLIHLLAYVAVGIAIPHQYELGTDFMAQPAVASFFTLLYAFVFGNMLLFKLITPLALSLGSELKIAKIERLGERTVYVEISGKNLGRFDFQAGQFFMLRILTGKQWWRPHPFSLSHFDSNSVGFTIGIRGDDTSWLKENRVGTPVILEGPYGVFTELKRSKQSVVLMGSGIGVTPILSLANTLASEPGDVSILYRVSEITSAPLLDDLEAVAIERGHRLHVEAGPRGKGGVFSLESDVEGVGDRLRMLQLFPKLHESDVYLCGPQAWTDRVIETLDELGVAKAQIHVEEFAW
jgi:predicted ferric reductase